MATRAYGQYCGLARAVEILGERWGLLIVRDLLVGPRRFTDLQHGLPGIPSNVLTSRLRELERAGVVARRILPRPERAVVYELTPYGQELEQAVIAFGRWGAKSLGDPQPDEVVTPDSLVMAMRSTFRPQATRGMHAGYELRLGPIVLGIRVDDGRLAVTAEPLPGADLVIEATPAIRELMAGELTPDAAIANGTVRLRGDAALLNAFAAMFHIDPKPGESP